MAKIVGKRRLRRRDYARDPVTLARELVGRRLVRKLDGHRLAGIIVETEAYIGVCDRASHAYQGRRTKRNESMYSGPGHAYVYFTYGMHEMFNIVCGEAGEPVAVLVRALEPTEGLAEMRRRRSRRPRKAPLREVDLCSGPGKLCESLGINRELDSEDLTNSSEIWIEEGLGALPEQELMVSRRIGVDRCQEWAMMPLRWLVADSPHVSAPVRPATVRLPEFTDRRFVGPIIPTRRS